MDKLTLEDLNKSFKVKVDEHTVYMQNFRVEMQVLAEKLLNDMTQELFQKYPEVLCLSWTQGTPGFNDGEPCNFSVNELTYVLKCEFSDMGPEDLDDALYDLLQEGGSYIATEKDIAIAKVYRDNCVVQTKEELESAISTIMSLQPSTPYYLEHRQRERIEYTFKATSLQEFELNYNKLVRNYTCFVSTVEFISDFNSFKNAFSAIPEEIFDNLYEGNSRVTIYSDKVCVDEYDCDY